MQEEGIRNKNLKEEKTENRQWKKLIRAIDHGDL